MKDKETMTAAAPPEDPHGWLEDVAGDASLAWVRARNAETDGRLASTPAFAQLRDDIRAVLDSDARIPYVHKVGAHFYNFWRDAEHERGIWRRTTLDEYRKPQPQWETLLDLDALNRAEGENWVWHGADCLRPDYRRCLIALSRGGADADVTREFDLVERRFVEDGFFRAESKGGMGWIDRDSVYVCTDFGPGSLTSSGYPRVVKQWRRGTSLADAEVVYEGLPDDMIVSAVHDDTPGFERDFVIRTLAFYRDELYLRHADGSLSRIDAPDSAIKSVHREWLTLELREPWVAGGRAHAAGALLAIRFDAFLRGERDFDVLFEPSATRSLAGASWTLHHLVLNVLDDVKNRLSVLTPGPSGWTPSAFVGAPAFGTLGVGAVDSDESDAVWLTATDYLSPTTLSLAQIGQAPEPLKAMPAFFDAERQLIEQHFATSLDGTRVPYFVVRPKALTFDGSAPTLLYGYGGFEISLTPQYSGAMGRAWLDRGGVYVVANIRGGGEYGPGWHQGALREKRPRAYEDFAAVARDLVARGITSAPQLGIQGGSNGGLLVGNMLTQYPELFGAVVVQVPLLDMQRYHHLLAGASWMAEYGDPDLPADWAFMRGFSPYHLFDAARRYPPVMFLTSTRDDRVHPAHARKMAALMLAAGKAVDYYENIEGGHGGAADNAQAAHMEALAYSFLWEKLGARA
ncbi:prolyl oligopeptidase family serine peptidase [Variovorax sp. J22P168]|uniref:prolyl oligopeptidase family serine peptidase n=1 Tax=Variovorax jilinensis TaxID=3053513 RepID=UPI002577865A|nr:prolyl oligopeptidase family serine peptidase [Variovorax sp. J22P168]MDM0010867.1 prolyl oligopeptidase family serine peptidase [Variovorax sp. J22P168]